MNIKAITAALTIAAALTLTGCAGTEPTVNETTTPAAVTTTAPTAATSPTVEPTETPEPVVVNAGDTLTAEQAANLPDGVRAYTTADGSTIAVVDGQPVPEVVKTELAAPVVAATAALTGQDEARSVYHAAMDQVSATYKATGLNAIVVYRGRGAYGYAYNATGGAKMKSATSSKAPAVAAAEAYVAAQANPSAFVIIDATGE